MEEHLRHLQSKLKTQSAENRKLKQEIRQLKEDRKNLIDTLSHIADSGNTKARQTLSGLNPTGNYKFLDRLSSPARKDSFEDIVQLIDLMLSMGYRHHDVADVRRNLEARRKVSLEIKQKIQ